MRMDISKNNSLPWSANRKYKPLCWLTEKEIDDISRDERLNIRWIDNNKDEEDFLEREGSKRDLIELSEDLRKSALDTTIICFLKSVTTSEMDWTYEKTQKVLCFKALVDDNLYKLGHGWTRCTVSLNVYIKEEIKNEYNDIVDL